MALSAAAALERMVRDGWHVRTQLSGPHADSHVTAWASHALRRYQIAIEPTAAEAIIKLAKLTAPR